MTRDVSRLLAPDFLSLTIGIVFYFVGVLITQRVKFLQNFRGVYSRHRCLVDLLRFSSSKLHLISRRAIGCW